MKNISYSTRLDATGEKICGGSFGGSIDMETVNRLVNNNFTVSIRPSGSPVFADKEGRNVNLYLYIDPDETEKGKTTRLSYELAKEQERERQCELEKHQQEEIENLTASLSHEEIIRRLKAE